MDAHGRPQSVLLVGGTSEIGLAIVRALAPRPGGRLVLAGRPGAGLDAAAAGLGSPGVEVVTVPFEADATDTHEAVLDQAFAGADVDVVVLAAGVLGDQDEYEHDADLAVRAAQVNYVGGLSMGLRSARRLAAQGHGTLVVLSSVAGERPRRSNFVYGSTKAGLDAVGLGVVEMLRGTGANAVVVRPGFVRTRMTAHLPDAPLATTPDEVGERVARAVRSGRELVYTPPLMRPVMSALRHVPRPLFRRLPL